MRGALGGGRCVQPWALRFPLSALRWPSAGLPDAKNIGAPSCVYGAAAPRNVLAGGAARHGDDDDYFSLSVMAPLYFEYGGGTCGQHGRRAMVAPVLANATASVLLGPRPDRWGEWPLLPTGLAIAVAGLAATIAGALTSSVVVATTGIFFGYLGTGMVLSPAQTAGCAACPTSWIPTA